MLKRKWVVAPSCPQLHLEKFSQFSPLIAQILYNRGITDLLQAKAFLVEDKIAGNSFQMLGMETAVNRLRAAIQAGDPIAVYGDFDTDGVTATALLVQTLRALGAKAIPYIPHRVEEGYGLNKDALSTLKEKGMSVVVTVDCGTRSLEEVDFGMNLGLDMIVTDHHMVGPELPTCCALVNPKQPGDPYPFKELSGVGIAFKLAQALLEFETRAPVGPSVPGIRMITQEKLLDLVALGTVADLVPLVGENRVLVKRGIKQLGATERPGLMALLQLAGARNRRIDAGTIGFFLGPRLNAAGRIDHARTAYKLLTTQYPGEAEGLAGNLEATNRERQQMTETMITEAREILAGQPPDQRILIVGSPHFPEGIVGLIASKLSEEAYRPAIALHMGEAESRGSCRSIPEYNIVSALDECADLLVRHGGHAAAAGFTVKNENLEALQARLRTIADRIFEGNEILPTLHIDVEANLPEMNWAMQDALDQLAPYGFGNREPVFMTRGAWVRNARIVGSNHLSLLLSNGSAVWDGIAFRQKEWMSALGQLPARVDVVYTLSRRNWGGEERLQLEVKDMRLSEAHNAR
ncbi:MAG: single-stranded-DNA-specific exonuclease RecJ [Anaerolineae bacterium]